jgi:tetratricopeptide (TPR) repeat protein
LQISLNKGAI